MKETMKLEGWVMDKKLNKRAIHKVKKESQKSLTRAKKAFHEEDYEKAISCLAVTLQNLPKAHCPEELKLVIRAVWKLVSKKTRMFFDSDEVTLKSSEALIMFSEKHFENVIKALKTISKTACRTNKRQIVRLESSSYIATQYEQFADWLMKHAVRYYQQAYFGEAKRRFLDSTLKFQQLTSLYYKNNTFIKSAMKTKETLCYVLMSSCSKALKQEQEQSEYTQTALKIKATLLPPNKMEPDVPEYHFWYATMTGSIDLFCTEEFSSLKKGSRKIEEIDLIMRQSSGLRKIGNALFEIKNILYFLDDHFLSNQSERLQNKIKTIEFENGISKQGLFKLRLIKKLLAETEFNLSYNQNDFNALERRFKTLSHLYLTKDRIPQSIKMAFLFKKTIHDLETLDLSLIDTDITQFINTHLELNNFQSAIEGMLVKLRYHLIERNPHEIRKEVNCIHSTFVLLNHTKQNNTLHGDVINNLYESIYPIMIYLIDSCIIEEKHAYFLDGKEQLLILGINIADALCDINKISQKEGSHEDNALEIIKLHFINVKLKQRALEKKMKFLNDEMLKESQDNQDEVKGFSDFKDNLSELAKQMKHLIATGQFEQANSLAEKCQLNINPPPKPQSTETEAMQLARYYYTLIQIDYHLLNAHRIFSVDSKMRYYRLILGWLTNMSDQYLRASTVNQGSIEYKAFSQLYSQSLMNFSYFINNQWHTIESMISHINAHTTEDNLKNDHINIDIKTIQTKRFRQYQQALVQLMRLCKITIPIFDSEFISYWKTGKVNQSVFFNAQQKLRRTQSSPSILMQPNPTSNEVNSQEETKHNFEYNVN